MDRIHGKIFSWIFKGEAYIRKQVEGVPKRKISSINDLTKIRQGTLSIDPPTRNTENVIQTLGAVKELILKCRFKETCVAIKDIVNPSAGPVVVLHACIRMGAGGKKHMIRKWGPPCF